jgi:uncharacterized membrane protein
MKRLTFIALLLTLFSFAVPALFAQDTAEVLAAAPTVEVTPAPTEAPPPAEMPDPIPGTDYSLVQVVIIALAVLLLGVIAIFGVTVVQFSRNAINTLPPWAVDLLRKSATPLLDQLDLLTDIPGTQLDDQARAELRKLINDILAENALRAQARAQAKFYSKPPMPEPSEHPPGHISL